MMTPSVYQFVLTDRQWKREHRIAHARSMLKQAQAPSDRQFWREVLEANVGE